jgi:hypothetical protein
MLLFKPLNQVVLRTHGGVARIWVRTCWVQVAGFWGVGVQGAV